MKNMRLYIKIEKSTLVHHKVIRLKDVAKLYSPEHKVTDELYQQVLYIIKDDKKNNYIFSVMKLIELIHRNYPDIEIINFGESDFIIQYEPLGKEKKLWEYFKVAFVCCIVFFGAAFTIMTFNEDANVSKIFEIIYKSVIGTDEVKVSVLEISYAVGLPLGIIIFFNHFSKLKTGNDPTPMQVQLRLYESDMDDTLIENSTREGKSFDVH
ncbi:stage V sporulation protein AA [Anaerocolumna xylanovorans]|uniref:Stage V sporulation protein AA n=1 Tax=Anaerocolumna xylanovorans DSM 12503 TaxID=1121345 RepID=A0A1M7YH48_9FIRM|nr:stage V sporulation protein AA [Anaerocolumna xylanovorans]SHO51909.1 stage V sporulation protein AA [Anaerocolumna xylanovorans DSM 12503]